MGKETRIMKKRIYLSGAITGRDYAQVLAEFENAETHFTKLGYEAVNPAKTGTYQLSWFDNMTVALGLLKGCNCVYFLPNSEESRGVQVERIYAEKLGIKEVTL